MAKQPGKFAALAEFRHHSPPQEEGETATAVMTAPPPAPPVVRGRGRPSGKRSNPEFEPTNVLLRKRTKKIAGRILEDTESGQDLSELIEELLDKWISTRS
jgi:hypothetical protein